MDGPSALMLDSLPDDSLATTAGLQVLQGQHSWSPHQASTSALELLQLTTSPPGHQQHVYHRLRLAEQQAAAAAAPHFLTGP
jgi:hypothetical protein